jgi:hypothetical protein
VPPVPFDDLLPQIEQALGRSPFEVFGNCPPSRPCQRAMKVSTRAVRSRHRRQHTQPALGRRGRPHWEWLQPARSAAVRGRRVGTPPKTLT